MKLFISFIFVLFFLFNSLAHADNCDIANNDLTVSAGSTFDGNITGYCNVTIEDNARVQNGGITADGNVVLGENVTVLGAINAGGKVTIGANSTVQNNDVVAGGDVVLESDSTVDGNITSGGSVTLGENATVKNGSVTAAGEVTLKNGSFVNLNVMANGNITIEEGTVQNGDVSSGGDITLEDGAKVPNGDVTADGDITIKASEVNNGNIISGGDITLEDSITDHDVIAEDLVFLNGNVSIGNGSVCGKSGVDATEAVDGNGLNENRIHVGENCDDEWDGNPTVDFCESPVDISGYQIHDENNYTLGTNDTYEVPAIYSGLYVDGQVTLNNRSLFIGNIYATGKVELKNGATVQGDVHTESTIDLKNNANISGGACENVEPAISATYTFTFDNTQPQALVCEAHVVDIQVRLDDVVDTDYNKTITLSTDSGAGDWTIIDTNNARGVLSNGTAGDGNATYTFSDNDDGQIQLGLSHAQAGDVTLLVSNSDANATFDLNFSSTVLKVTQSCVDDSLGACINTANLPFNLTITAFKEDQQTNTCVTYNPSNILFWSEYITPDIPQGLAVEVDGSEIGNLTANATPLNVTFNNGIATLTVNYPDAGKIKIHAQDQDDLAATGEVQTIMNPVQLLIDNIMGNSTVNNLQNNPETTDNGNGFIRASVADYDDLQVDTFNIQVTALKDCSNDTKGHCSGLYGKRTPSFANEIDLESSLIFPNAGALGQLQYNGGAGMNDYQVSLTSGQFTYENLAYDEVGTLGVFAKTKNDENNDGYLIAGNHIDSKEVQNIGRFYPDYLAFDSFNVTPACNSDFTYIGQTGIEVSYNMKAYAQGGLHITTNYDYSLGYPVAGKGDTTALLDQIYDQGPLLLTSRLLPDTYYDSSLWLQGQYDVIGLQMGVAKTTSPDGPYFTNTNKIDYFIKLIGIDGEKIQTDSVTTCSDDSCFLGDLGNLVYGRLQAGNGHGSEYQAIRTNISSTYYNGSQFVDFARDLCTPIAMAQVSSVAAKNTADQITVTDTISGNSAQTTLSIINNPLINGRSQFNFSAPSNRGELDYYIELDSVTPWLLDSGNAVTCPNDTGTLTDCISGHVMFGLFRGNDRIIYRLQTFN